MSYEVLTEIDKHKITHKLVTSPEMTHKDISEELEVSTRQVSRFAVRNKFNIERKAREYYEAVADKAIEVSKNVIDKSHEISSKELSVLSPEEFRFQEKQGIPTVNKVMDSIIGSEKTQPIHIKNMYQQNNMEINPVVQTLLNGIVDKLKEDTSDE